MGSHVAGAAVGPAPEGKYLAQPDAGTARLHQEQCLAQMAPDALGSPTDDEAETRRIAKHAGVRSHSAPERSEFHPWPQRRRAVNAAGPEPHARRRPRSPGRVSIR